VGLSLFAFVLVVAGAVAQAQQLTKIPRIGYLSSGTPTSEAIRSEPIRQGLRELGYTEGQNIAIDYRYAARKIDRAPELVAELVRLKVDIILVESLARPGGNVTGITLLIRELGSKRLELFKEAVPKLTSVALLYADPAIAVRDLKADLPATARELKLTIQPWEVRDTDGFERVFDALSKKRPDGLYAYSSGPLMFANTKRIAGFVLKSRLPSMFFNREAVEAGGLMYYGADENERYRRVATYVDRILKGAKPADLPVQQATKFEFVVNLKAAKQIGLTIPVRVLEQSNQIIK
jgi:putative ABC transport system substrate-binding protein